MFITCLLLPGAAMAEEVRYRVEVLIMSHLDHDAEPREYHRIDNYSSAIDYLTPLPAPEEKAEECVEEDAATGMTDEITAGEGTDEPPEDPPEVELPRVLHVQEMSELMKENWRRLRLSAPFRPLQYLSWEQAADEPFPALRAHDLEVVLVEDPWAEQRALQEAEALDAAAGAEPPGDTGNCDSIEEPGIPDPVVYYRLDGTITLRRSRFLHLDVRLDWREPVFSQASAEGGTESDRSSLLPSYPQTGPAGPSEAPGEPAETAPIPDAFLVHRLEQSRLVRTDRLEYFDHPVLGVLAHITRFEVAGETEDTD